VAQKRFVRQSDRLRQALAQETAKIIVSEGVRDFHRAKLKASDRLGNTQHGSLPSNLEIESAISAYKNTFIPDSDLKTTTQRQIALDIMGWLQAFSPLLSGPVLEGTAGVNTPISIHVSAETVENIVGVLHECGVKTKLAQRRLKLNNNFVFLPTANFEYRNYEIDVLVFNLRQQHQHPKSKSQNRSMQRINLKSLKQLLATS